MIHWKKKLKKQLLQNIKLPYNSKIMTTKHEYALSRVEDLAELRKEKSNRRAFTRRVIVEGTLTDTFNDSGDPLRYTEVVPEYTRFYMGMYRVFGPLVNIVYKAKREGNDAMTIIDRMKIEFKKNKKKNKMRPQVVIFDRDGKMIEK